MTEERKTINYMVACVSEFAKANQMKQKMAFQFLFRNKGISFLKENYDVEHTLSFEEVIEDLMLICKKNGGSI